MSGGFSLDVISTFCFVDVQFCTTVLAMMSFVGMFLHVPAKFSPRVATCFSSGTCEVPIAEVSHHLLRI